MRHVSHKGLLARAAMTRELSVMSWGGTFGPRSRWRGGTSRVETARVLSVLGGWLPKPQLPNRVLVLFEQLDSRVNMYGPGFRPEDHGEDAAFRVAPICHSRSSKWLVRTDLFKNIELWIALGPPPLQRTADRGRRDRNQLGTEIQKYGVLTDVKRMSVRPRRADYYP